MLLGGAAYIGGALCYVNRIPERWYPKTFDHAGQSHNIFHLAVILGCGIHFNESMRLFLTRREMICPITFPDTFTS